jgi:hypothetical protein
MQVKVEKKSNIHNGGCILLYRSKRSLIRKMVGWDQRPGRVEKWLKKEMQMIGERGQWNPNETVVVVECGVDADGALVPAHVVEADPCRGIVLGNPPRRNRLRRRSPPPASSSPPGHRGCVEMKRRVQTILRVHCWPPTPPSTLGLVRLRGVKTPRVFNTDMGWVNPLPTTYSLLGFNTSWD